MKLFNYIIIIIFIYMWVSQYDISIYLYIEKEKSFIFLSVHILKFAYGHRLLMLSTRYDFFVLVLFSWIKKKGSYKKSDLFYNCLTKIIFYCDHFGALVSLWMFISSFIREMFYWMSYITGCFYLILSLILLINSLIPWYDSS